MHPFTQVNDCLLFEHINHKDIWWLFLTFFKDCFDHNDGCQTLCTSLYSSPENALKRSLLLYFLGECQAFGLTFKLNFKSCPFFLNKIRYLLGELFFVVELKDEASIGNFGGLSFTVYFLKTKLCGDIKVLSLIDWKWSCQITRLHNLSYIVPVN